MGKTTSRLISLLCLCLAVSLGTAFAERFTVLPEGSNQPILTEKEILSVVIAKEQGSTWIELHLNEKGTKVWADFSGANLEKNVEIKLGGKLLASPRIKNKMPAGVLPIPGLVEKDVLSLVRTFLGTK